MCVQTTFTPAIYICADCELQHNGDAKALPQGWDRVTDPITRTKTVRCPDCLEAIEQGWIEAHRAGIGLAPRASIMLGAIERRYVGIGTTIGRAA